MLKKVHTFMKLLIKDINVCFIYYKNCGMSVAYRQNFKEFAKWVVNQMSY